MSAHTPESNVVRAASIPRQPLKIRRPPPRFSLALASPLFGGLLAGGGAPPFPGPRLARGGGPLFSFAAGAPLAPLLSFPRRDRVLGAVHGAAANRRRR